MVDLYIWIGKAYTLMKNDDKAIKYFEMALKDKPNSSKALFNLGKIYEKKKKNETSQRKLSESYRYQSKVH